MSDVISAILMITGTVFVLVAGVGILRMPDLYMRMSATAKATTLGVACILASAAVHFGEPEVTSRAVAIIAFVLLTSPVAAHMIGRAAYFTGVPLWDRSVCDELRERRDVEGDAPESTASGEGEHEARPSRPPDKPT